MKTHYSGGSDINFWILKRGEMTCVFFCLWRRLRRGPLASRGGGCWGSYQAACLLVPTSSLRASGYGLASPAPMHHRRDIGEYLGMLTDQTEQYICTYLNDST